MINQGICFKCHQYKKLEEHHIFGGPNRKNSQKYKLTVNLCAGCHREDADSAHRSAETAQWLHEYGQKLAMKKYGWTKEEFREVPFNANGCFYAESGKILIDVNSDRGVMNTLSHELVHLIRSESEYEYRKLADWLVNKYHEKGQNLNSLVYKKMDEENIEDYDAAFEEVVAESWSLALETERTVDNLTELARENKGLFDTLKEGFEKIFNGFKDYLKTYNPILKTREAWNAQALSQLDEYSDLFTQALYNVTHGEKAAVISANEEKMHVREEKYQSRIGTTEDGKGIYKTNYKKGTPKAVKQNNLISLVQSVWSKNPIELSIIKDGKVRSITARFNPELSERSDLSKIAFGNRKGTASEKRITLDLSSDLYQIAEDATYSYSKKETGKKDNKAHKDVSEWHYFLTNLVYEDEDGNRQDCHMNIDVKQAKSGFWFYSFAIEKGTAPQTLLAEVTDKSATVPTNSIDDSDENVNGKNKKQLKAEQWNIIKNSNPATDDIHAWIRSAGDILTFTEAVKENGREDFAPDYTYSDMQKAFESGEITVYSSKPIENGTFVTPSKTEAQNYAGNGKVYSQQVNTADVAWLDAGQGQYAHVGDIESTENDDVRYQTKTDSEYMSAVKSGNESRAQELVDKAAKAWGALTDKAGKPLKLYHGTQSFGFTEFDLNRMDDKRSIFLTSDLTTASTYSGAKGERKIGKGTKKLDYKKASLSELAEYMGKYHIFNDGLNAKYKYYDEQQVDKALSEGKQALNQLIKELKSVLQSNKLTDNQVKKANELLNSIYFNPAHVISAQLYIAINGKEKYLNEADFKDIYKKISLWATLSGTAKDTTQGIIVKNSLDYYFDLFTREEAVEELERFSSADSGNYFLYTKLNNPLTVDAEGENWNHIPAKSFDFIAENGKPYMVEYATTRQFAKTAYAQGYDGVVFRNVVDNGGRSYESSGIADYIVVAFNPENVKSADAVTYDNDGEVIPLSERFSESKDIRYQSKLSDRAVEHLQSENKYLKRLLRIQGQLTHGKLFTRTSTQEVAKSVINQFGAKGMDWVKLGDTINKAYESIMDNANHHNLSWDTIMDELRPIAKEIHDSIPLRRSEQATDILKYIHSSNIRLDDVQKQEVTYTFGSYDRFRKALMGSVTVSNFGTELDSWWQGAAEDFPDVFRADINSADMGVELYDIINGLKESYEDDYGDEAVNEIAQELYDKFWTAATLYTEADKHAREINELKAKHRENIQKIKEDYDLRLKTQNAAEKYVQKQKDMMKDKADRIEKTATKNQIIKELTKVANSLTANSKNNYIPDDLKPFAKALLEAVNGVNVYIDSSVLDNIPDELEEGNVLTMLTYEVKRAARGKSVGEMSLEETRTVYRAVKALRRAIDFEKEAIIGDKRVEISNSAQKLISQIGERAKDKIVYEGKIRPMFWSLLDPVRAFNHIGSAELTSYFNEARKGDDTMALNIQEIMKFTESLAKKYNTKKWNMDELLEISFSDFIPSEENNDPGRPKEIKETVTLNELMYMYALTKREQAYEHLEVGGYVLKNAIKIKNKHLQRTAKGTKISVQELRAICSQMLTQEQRTYVDECVEYMSTVMAAKGNEISQKLYGIDLFTEEFYIPIISSGDYIKGETKAELKTKDLGDNYKMLKNMGFTNSVQVKANNPILIQDFTSVFTEHCNEMAMYNSYVIGIENLNKLFKWKGDGESVSAAITNGCGYSATAYINTFLKDLNGGRTAERNGILDQGAKLFGKMKKTAVGYSFSTVIQQPTAIVRAMAMIEPKYFIAQSIHHKQTWNELKEHCPVAITKELGGFDMGSKKTTAKAIEDTMLKTKALDVVDEVGMWGAAKGDELGWNIIWNAVKAETKAEHKSISEAEYWKICKERFTEVVTNTQVYDSVFTRSDIMRSKNPLAKLSTAFMGEPTKVLNMYIQAITDAKRGKTSKLHGLRVFASVIMSQILAAVAKSLPYALRDDDDDKSLTEKYMYKLCYSLIDELNPINLLPYIRDGWDALCGDSNMRGDFAIFNEITNAYKALSSNNKSGYRKAEEFIGSISKLLGLPVKNIMREFRSVRNLFASIYNGNFFEPIDRQTLQKDVIDNLPEMPLDIDEKIKNEFAVTVKRASALMDKGKFEKGKRILLEYKEQQIEKYLKKGYTQEKAEKEAKSDMRTGATTYYKPLYLEAVENKDYANMNRIKTAMTSMGIYDDVQKTVDKWVKDSQK